MIASDGPPHEKHGTPHFMHGARQRSRVTEPKHRHPCERKQTAGSKSPWCARRSSETSLLTMFRVHEKQTLRRSISAGRARKIAIKPSKMNAACGGQPGM